MGYLGDTVVIKDMEIRENEFLSLISEFKKKNDFKLRKDWFFYNVL